MIKLILYIYTFVWGGIQHIFYIFIFNVFNTSYNLHIQLQQSFSNNRSNRQKKKEKKITTLLYMCRVNNQSMHPSCSNNLHKNIFRLTSIFSYIHTHINIRSKFLFVLSFSQKCPCCQIRAIINHCCH